MDYLGPNVQLRGRAARPLGRVPEGRRLLRPPRDPLGLHARRGTVARSTRSCARATRAGSSIRSTTTRAGPNTTGAPIPSTGCATTQDVRRVILSRFGPAQLAPGEWVHDLQERFSLAYLYHRFGIQAAQQYVGGQFQANAVKGDGQTPLDVGRRRQQRKALDLLMKALAPENLDIPDAVLAALVAAAVGHGAHARAVPVGRGRDLQPAQRGALAGRPVVHPLLDPQRAARLTLARGAERADAARASFAASSPRPGSALPDASPRLAALRRVSQRVVLDGLMDLAAQPQASPEVRAATDRGAGAAPPQPEGDALRGRGRRSAPAPGRARPGRVPGRPETPASAAAAPGRAAGEADRLSAPDRRPGRVARHRRGARRGGRWSRCGTRAGASSPPTKAPGAA